MKKIGNVRVEIETEGQKEYYIRGIDFEAEDWIPKSAVTDIREEVDWSKVKENTPVVMWEPGNDPYEDGVVGFYGYTKADKHYSSWMRSGEKTIMYYNIMLLTDWLKEYGDKKQ